MTGHLIVIEGPDGVGKSTVALKVTARLAASGIPCRTLSFPGKDTGTVGALVYEIHHHPEDFGISRISPLCKQVLHIAAHIDSIQERIMPLINQGTSIILDRYWWSTLVYGIVGGINRKSLQMLIDFELDVWGSVSPSIAILLRRQAPIDRDEDPFIWNALKNRYDDLVKVEAAKHRIVSIDNVGSQEELLEDVYHRVFQLFNNTSG